MKMLSSEVKTLLDKLYNLRGEDSVILAKMNEERDEAIATKERTKKEKEVLLERIDKLTLESKTLKDEGEKLSSILKGINKKDFATVLDRLRIDFDPDKLSHRLDDMLPGTIKKVSEENKKAQEELTKVETEMNDAITKEEELGIRKDEALSNQSKLNEYFSLALQGNINITRDEITSLLEKFNFNEDEQREAAKILMFPEDALYDYDRNKDIEQTGKSITDVLVEAKKESKVEEDKEEIVKLEDSEVKLTNIFDKAIEEESNKLDETPVIKEEVKEEKTKSDKDTLVEFLNNLKVNAYAISEDNLHKILEEYDEELIKTNVEVLNKHGVSLDVVINNVGILTDRELEQKLDKLFDIGKEARDINHMPNVLVKYNLQDLTNTINVLQISGLDPKKVPLMAY